MKNKIIGSLVLLITGLIVTGIFYIAMTFLAFLIYEVPTFTIVMLALGGLGGRLSTKIYEEQ